MPESLIQPKTTDQAARDAADRYWQHRAKGERVSIDDVIGLPHGSDDYKIIRASALNLIVQEATGLTTGATASMKMPLGTAAPATQAPPPPASDQYAVTAASAAVTSANWAVTADVRVPTDDDSGTSIGAPASKPAAAFTAGSVAGHVAGTQAATAGMLGNGPPPNIEGYDIVGCLGRGGMGAVFEGYQQSTGRRVAIKLMLDAIAPSADARIRFEREVEVVARLEHPGIVSVIDSGVRKGNYYYVMEYVDGKQFDEYVQPGKGDPRTALSLLAQVCEAVDYAHQRGVLHRDLKPTNIIVDPRGKPHLLDFGIAKVMDGPGAQPQRKMELTMSQPGQLLGTIAYMSPEQAQGRHDQTSVRTDVYALGAIGYQLISGKLPCSLEGTLRDVLTRIAERDPAPPSTIRRGIARDVDAILLKALEKAPEGRFATAGELARDLRRWLANEPVTARRVGITGHAWRWARRNRALAAVIAIAFVTLTTVSTALISRVIEERDRASRERDHALENFRLLRGVLESADPEKSATVLQLLDSASMQLDSNTPRLSLTEADVRETLGLVYKKFGRYDKALAHQKRVLEIREQSYTGDSVAVAEALHNLAATLWWEGKYGEAEVLYERSLAMRQRIFPKEHPAIAFSLTHLAACRLQQGRLDEATRLHGEALRMRRSLYGPQHEEVAQSINNLAKCEMELERLESAERLFREAVALITSLKGEGTGSAAATQNLAECLMRRSHQEGVVGDPAHAKELAREARDSYLSSYSVRSRIFPAGTTWLLFRWEGSLGRSWRWATCPKRPPRRAMAWR